MSGYKPSKVVQLVEKQNFDGSWKLYESLCEIISKPLDKIKEAAVVKVCRQIKNIFGKKHTTTIFRCKMFFLLEMTCTVKLEFYV